MGHVVSVTDIGEFSPLEIRAESLCHCKEVGQCLAGMVAIAQAIDHGDICPFGQLINRLLTEYPGHHHVEVP